VTTTDALFAGKVQRKVSNGVAGFAAADHLWIGTKSRQFLPSRRLTNIRARRASEILALGPSCGSSPAQLKREESLWPEFRLHSGESARHFKGIFCDDFSEFESDQLSYAVGSL
jgi:hypothetical protein